MTVVHFKGTREAPRKWRSEMETRIISISDVEKWQLPPFQRPLRINDKVRSIADELRANQVEIAGVITLGTIGDDKTLWIIDGQHRLQAFKMSELAEVIGDLRICRFADLAEAAAEGPRAAAFRIFLCLIGAGAPGAHSPDDAQKSPRAACAARSVGVSCVCVTRCALAPAVSPAAKFEGENRMSNRVVGFVRSNSVQLAVCLLTSGFSSRWSR